VLVRVFRGSRRFRLELVRKRVEAFACSSLGDRMSRMAGTLYLVATPIGNLEDITHRAIRILREVKLIACEDTRHTRKLLNHYGINTRTISYHEHNERERATELLKLLETGADVAIVSDAGTPGISDPGFQLARLAIESGVAVVPIPGPSALIAALIVSGVPTDEFFFAGFLPARSVARRTRLGELGSIPATLIFYEAPHRIAATLRDAYEILGERKAVVARELTKMHEEIARGRLSELRERFSSREHARGEMVLIIDRAVIKSGLENNDPGVSISALVTALEAEGLDHRAALKKAARQLGLSRDEAYRRLVSERGH
jgi:16S rRNA (cytidine1402-2'-O)-methyltransferase